MNRETDDQNPCKIEKLDSDSEEFKLKVLDSSDRPRVVKFEGFICTTCGLHFFYERYLKQHAASDCATLPSNVPSVTLPSSTSSGPSAAKIKTEGNEVTSSSSNAVQQTSIKAGPSSMSTTIAAAQLLSKSPSDTIVTPSANKMYISGKCLKELEIPKDCLEYPSSIPANNVLRHTIQATFNTHNIDIICNVSTTKPSISKPLSAPAVKMDPIIKSNINYGLIMEDSEHTMSAVGAIWDTPTVPAIAKCTSSMPPETHASLTPSISHVLLMPTGSPVPTVTPPVSTPSSACGPHNSSDVAKESYQPNVTVVPFYNNTSQNTGDTMKITSNFTDFIVIVDDTDTQRTYYCMGTECVSGPYTLAVLEEHYQTAHSGACPVSCPNCKSVFIFTELYRLCRCINIYAQYKYKVTENFKIHADRKPFQCHMCDFCSSEKGLLTAHFYVHGKKQICCIYCPLRTYSRELMVCHTREHEWYQAEMRCQASLPQPHTRFHPYPSLSREWYTKCVLDYEKLQRRKREKESRL